MEEPTRPAWRSGSPASSPSPRATPAPSSSRPACCRTTSTRTRACAWPAPWWRFMNVFQTDEPAGCIQPTSTNADVFVTWGANMAEAHPMLYSRLTARKLSGKNVKHYDLGTHAHPHVRERRHGHAVQAEHRPGHRELHRELPRAEQEVRRGLRERPPAVQAGHREHRQRHRRRLRRERRGQDRRRREPHHVRGVRRAPGALHLRVHLSSSPACRRRT